MNYLGSVLYELDQEVITGGPLMTAVQAVGVPIHRHTPSLQRIPGICVGINQKQQLRMQHTCMAMDCWLTALQSQQLEGDAQAEAKAGLTGSKI